MGRGNAMKRMLSVLLAALLVIGAGIAAAAAEEQPEMPPTDPVGDVNGDDAISVPDAAVYLGVVHRDPYNALLVLLSAVGIDPPIALPAPTPEPTPAPAYDFSGAQAGDRITFGRYEQDNDPSNGEEPIEWRVLDREGGRLLVISEYALDRQNYNPWMEDVTWETCQLRTWLNDSFLNIAFTAAEQTMIPTVTVVNDDNPAYGTDGGNDTQDRVFLLSISEAKRYFADNRDRQTVPTAYAAARGADSLGLGLCMWWLRSPGCDQPGAVCVRNGGDIFDSGFSVCSAAPAVRPVLWIETGA